jgi:hypothetical protein
VIADGAGQAIAFRIAPGQAHELAHAILLLGILPDVPKWVVGNRGYTSDSFRGHTWKTGHGGQARPRYRPRGHLRAAVVVELRWKGAATLKCCAGSMALRQGGLCEGRPAREAT